MGGQTYSTTGTTTSAYYTVQSKQVGTILGSSVGCAFGSTVADATSSILGTLTAANGKGYTFLYDQTYGLLKEVDYPDGGWSNTHGS